MDPSESTDKDKKTSNNANAASSSRFRTESECSATSDDGTQRGKRLVINSNSKFQFLIS